MQNLQFQPLKKYDGHPYHPNIGSTTGVVSQARETCVRSLFLTFEEICLTCMESNEELLLFEMKLKDEIFIPNKRVKQMTKEELLQILKSRKVKTLREVRRHLLTPGRVGVKYRREKKN